MNVLITGADGFIGSHLVELLLKNGYSVKALSQYNSFNYWGWLEDIEQNSTLEVITGDIRDPFFCDDLTKDIDIVFHLAALIAIPYSYKAPQSYVETNINGTLNICNASLRSQVKRVLVTSTSEVYGTAQYVPIDEKHPKQPQSPYSASKIGADAIAMSFFNSFELPVTIVRPFNTYGPRQSARAIISSIISQIQSGSKSIKVGDLTPTRDFTFVKDICSGMLAIAKSDTAIGKEINISTNTEISIGETINLIKKITGSTAVTDLDEQRIRPQNSEVFKLMGDNSLIKSITGWAPKYSFEEGLKETIEWFKNSDNLKKYKSGIYNI
ncbi:MAG: SDR family NAD(P)-dependent oxidoreductase [Bacteroidales bacterium]|nr:MAG: SDR family NAD(P)-dependent oxidoreductase [Bacteroidales bacterium]